MVATMALFISCGDNAQALKEINTDLQEPLGTASNIRMIYTDSIKIQAILTAPKHVDYTNLSFRYAEFPEGLKVIFLRRTRTRKRSCGRLWNFIQRYQTDRFKRKCTFAIA